MDYTSDIETELKNLFFVNEQTDDFMPEIKYNNMLMYLYAGVTIFILVVMKGIVQALYRVLRKSIDNFNQTTDIKNISRKPKRKRPDTMISQVYSTVNLQVYEDIISREDVALKIQNDSSSTCDNGTKSPRPRHVIPSTSPFQSCLTYQDISSGDNCRLRKAARTTADDEAPTTQYHSTISKTTSSTCYKDNVVTEPPMFTMELFKSKPSNLVSTSRTQETDAVKQKSRSNWTLCTDQHSGDRKWGEAGAARIFEPSDSSEKISVLPLVTKKTSHVVCKERATVESRTFVHKLRRCSVLEHREGARQEAVVPVVPLDDGDVDTHPLSRLISLVTVGDRDHVDSHLAKHKQQEDSVYTTWETDDKITDELGEIFEKYQTKQKTPSDLDKVVTGSSRLNDAIEADVLKRLRKMKQLYKLTPADCVRYQEAKFRLLKYFNVRLPDKDVPPLKLRWEDWRKKTSTRLRCYHEKIRDYEKNHDYEKARAYEKISDYETVRNHEKIFDYKIVRDYEKDSDYEQASDSKQDSDSEKDHYRQKDHDNELVLGYKKVRSYEKVRMIESLTSLKDACLDAHKDNPQTDVSESCSCTESLQDAMVAQDAVGHGVAARRRDVSHKHNYSTRANGVEKRMSAHSVRANSGQSAEKTFRVKVSNINRPWYLCDSNLETDSDISPKVKKRFPEDSLSQRGTDNERSKAKCERSSSGQSRETTSAANIFLTLSTFLDAKESEQLRKKGKTSEKEQTDFYEFKGVDVSAPLAVCSHLNKATETCGNSTGSEKVITVTSENRPNNLDKPGPNLKLPPKLPSRIPSPEKGHGRPMTKQHHARHNQTRLPTLKTKSPKPLTLKPPIKKNKTAYETKQHNLALAKSKQLDLANKFSVKNWKRGVLRNMKRDLDNKIKNKKKPQTDNRGKVEAKNENVAGTESVHSMKHLTEAQTCGLSSECKEILEGNQVSSEVRGTGPEVSDYFTVPEFDCSYKCPDADIPASSVTEVVVPSLPPIVEGAPTPITPGVEDFPQSSPEARNIFPTSQDALYTHMESIEEKNIIRSPTSEENNPQPTCMLESVIKLENTFGRRETNVGTSNFEYKLNNPPDSGAQIVDCPNSAAGIQSTVETFQEPENILISKHTRENTTVFINGPEKIFAGTDIAENTPVPPVRKRYDPDFHHRTPSPGFHRRTPSSDTQRPTPSPDIQRRTPSSDIQRRTPSPDIQRRTPSSDFEKVDPNVLILLHKDAEDQAVDLKRKSPISNFILPQSVECDVENTIHRLASELLRLEKHFSPTGIDRSSFERGMMLGDLIYPGQNADARTLRQSSTELSVIQSPERAEQISIEGGKKTRQTTTVIWSSADMNDLERCGDKKSDAYSNTTASPRCSPFLVRYGDRKSEAYSNSMTPSSRCSPVSFNKGSPFNFTDTLHRSGQLSPVKTKACQCLPAQELSIDSLALEEETCKASNEKTNTVPVTKLSKYLIDGLSLVNGQNDSNEEKKEEGPDFRSVVHVDPENVFHQTSCCNQSELKMVSAMSIEEIKTELSQKEQISISQTLPTIQASNVDDAKNDMKVSKSHGVIAKKFSIPLKCRLTKGKNLPSNENERQFKVHTVKINGVKGPYVKSNSQNKIAETKSKDQTSRYDEPGQIKSDSYTTKHKSLENNVKNNWRGTPAFQRKLQFLLKNNKYVFKKNAQPRNVAAVIKSSTELILNKKNAKSTAKLEDPVPVKSDVADKMLSKNSKRNTVSSQAKPWKVAQNLSKESTQLESDLTKALCAYDPQSPKKRLLSRKNRLKYKSKSLNTDVFSPLGPVVVGEEKVTEMPKVHFETPKIFDEQNALCSDHPLVTEAVKSRSVSHTRQSVVPVKPYDICILHPSSTVELRGMSQFDVLPDIYGSFAANSESGINDATGDLLEQSDDKIKSTNKIVKKPHGHKRPLRNDKLRLNRKCQTLRNVSDKIDNQTYEHETYQLSQTKTEIDGKCNEGEISFDFLDLGNQQPMDFSSHSEESLMPSITSSRKYSKLLEAYTGSRKTHSYKTLSSLYKQSFNELKKSDLVDNPFEARLTNLSHLLQSYNDVGRTHWIASPPDNTRFIFQDAVSAQIDTDTSHLAQISNPGLSASESSCEEVNKFSFPLISSAQDLNPVKLIKADLVMGPSVRTSDDDSEELLGSIGHRQTRSRYLSPGVVPKDAALRMYDRDPITTNTKIQKLLYRRGEIKAGHVMVSNLSEQKPITEDNNVLDILLSSFTNSLQNNLDTSAFNEIGQSSKSPKPCITSPFQFKNMTTEIQTDDIISNTKEKLEIDIEHPLEKCLKILVPETEQLFFGSQISPQTNGDNKVDKFAGLPRKWEMKHKDMSHVITADDIQCSSNLKCDNNERNRCRFTLKSTQGLGDIHEILNRKSPDIYPITSPLRDCQQLREVFKTSEKSPESLKLRDINSKMNTANYVHPSSHTTIVKSDVINQDVNFSDQRKAYLHRSLSYCDKIALNKADDVTLKSSESCTVTYKPNVRLSLVISRSTDESQALTIDGQNKLRKRSLENTSPFISMKKRRLTSPHFHGKEKCNHPLKMTIRKLTSGHQECHFKSSFKQSRLMPQITSSVSGTTSISLAEIFKVTRAARKKGRRVCQSRQVECRGRLRSFVFKQSACDDSDLSVDKSEQVECDRLSSLDQLEQVKCRVFTSADKSEQAECNNFVCVDKSEQTECEKECVTVDKSEQAECDNFLTVDKSEQVEYGNFLTVDKSEQVESYNFQTVDKSDQTVCDNFLNVGKMSINSMNVDILDSDKCKLFECDNFASAVGTLKKANERTFKEDIVCRDSHRDIDNSLLDLAVNKTQDLESLLNFELISKDESQESNLHQDTKLLFNKAGKSAHKVGKNRRRSSLRLTALPKHFPFTRENKCLSPDLYKASPHLPQPHERKHQKLSDFLQDARNCCVVSDVLSHVPRSKASSVTNTVHSSEEDEERLLEVLGRPVERQYSRSKMKHLDMAASDSGPRSVMSLEDDIETEIVKEEGDAKRAHPGEISVDQRSPQFDLKIMMYDADVEESKFHNGQCVHYVLPLGIGSPKSTEHQQSVVYTKSYSDPNLMEDASLSQFGESNKDQVLRPASRQRFNPTTSPRQEQLLESQPDSLSSRSRDTHVHISEMYLTQSTIDRINAENDISLVAEENPATAEREKINPSRSSSSSSIVLSWIGSDISEADNALAGNMGETPRHEQTTRSGFHFTAASFIGSVGGISKERCHGDFNNDNTLLLRHDPVHSFNSLYNHCEQRIEWDGPDDCRVKEVNNVGSFSDSAQPFDNNKECPLTCCGEEDKSDSKHNLLMDPAAMLGDSYGYSALYFPFTCESEKSCGPIYSVESNSLTPSEPNRQVSTNSERKGCKTNPPEKSAQPKSKTVQSERDRFSKKRNKLKVKEEQENTIIPQHRAAKSGGKKTLSENETQHISPAGSKKHTTHLLSSKHSRLTTLLNTSKTQVPSVDDIDTLKSNSLTKSQQAPCSSNKSVIEDISTAIHRPQTPRTSSPSSNNNMPWSVMSKEDITNDGPIGQEVANDPVQVTSPAVHSTEDTGVDLHSDCPPVNQGIDQPDDKPHEASTQSNTSATTPQKVKNIIKMFEKRNNP